MEIFESDEYADWIDNLRDSTAAVRIDAKFRYWETTDHIVGDVKPVGDGVSEVRFTFGPGYRVYFAHKRDRLVLLVFGGDKSRQSRDIARAKEILQRYKQEGQW